MRQQPLRRLPVKVVVFVLAVVGIRAAVMGWLLADSTGVVIRPAWAPALPDAAASASLEVRLLALDLVLLGVVALIAYWYTATLVRPLQALWRATRRIARGEFSVRVADSERQDEIGQLSRTFNDMAQTLHENQIQIVRTQRELTERNDQLQAANEVLAQLSITDGLTKLHNHRFFQDHLTREIKRVRRTREPLAMLLVDIDDFKKLNDRCGHAAGDAVLVRIAQIMNDHIRESDLLARYGGEEFVVLAPRTDLTGAVNLAEKLRTAVAEAPLVVDDTMARRAVTISIGVARFSGDRKAFFNAADRALYEAKHHGKDCVVTDPD